MAEKMLGTSHDTDNTTEYALTCNIIRDFCKDAIASGRLPTDREIHSAAHSYVIEHEDADESDEYTAEATQPLLMKPTEAARLTGLSTRTITRMCDAGQLPAVKLRGSWRINRKALMQLLGGAQ
jgi:excisionase family DNA binding protein